jgi:lipopolysaccharide transport system ATP-binding protein
MSDIVIRAEGLGKRYRRGVTGPPETLRDALTRIVGSPLAAMRRPTQEHFWALRDVGLEVRHGEVLGLIGRNGAGKTTLLKILSRITRPTTGWAEIHGRVRSLLEVGTGFHGELSGRENTYLSGSILGMGKREIDRKFDEIVAFAEVDKFIDTPVKHYSSGMYVRLAFAVAAHLEPEILLVDEVLAVGDINFQKKCLGKMGDVAKAGRTIVLVSHQMAAINALASRVILMKSGTIECDGSPSEVTARYYADSLGPMQNQSNLLLCAREGEGQAKFSSIVIQPLDGDDEPVPVAYPGCNLSIELGIECYSSISDSNAAVIVYDQTGYRVVDVNTAQKNDYVRLNAGEKAKVSFLVRDVLLKPGEYYVGLWLGRHSVGVADHIENAASFSVMESDENSQHYVIYPGVYLCRFEENISVLQVSPETLADCDLRHT